MTKATKRLLTLSMALCLMLSIPVVSYAHNGRHHEPTVCPAETSCPERKCEELCREDVCRQIQQCRESGKCDSDTCRNWCDYYGNDSKNFKEMLSELSEEDRSFAVKEMINSYIENIIAQLRDLQELIKIA